MLNQGGSLENEVNMAWSFHACCATIGHESVGSVVRESRQPLQLQWPLGAIRTADHCWGSLKDFSVCIVASELFLAPPASPG